MNDKFDELAKSMAQSVARRGALKKFGGGLLGLALAALGLPNQASASRPCASTADCPPKKATSVTLDGACQLATAHNPTVGAIHRATPAFSAAVPIAIRRDWGGLCADPDKTKGKL